MKEIYISHLLPDEDMIALVKEYQLGIETIDFGIGENLDRVEQTLEMYQERIRPIAHCPMAVHGPFLDLNPVSYDSQVSRVSRERFEQTYEIAKKMNAKVLVFHSCFIPATNFLVGWVERQIDFWKEFLKQKDDSISVCIENVFDPDWRPLKEIVEGVGLKSFSVCLDIGHANVFSDQKVETWIQNLGSTVGHIHVHDNNGRKDEHLALGKGNIPVKEVLDMERAYCRCSSCTLENNSREAVEDSLDYILYRRKC